MCRPIAMWMGCAGRRPQVVESGGAAPAACLDLAWLSGPCTSKQPQMFWRDSALLLRRVWRLGYIHLPHRAACSSSINIGSSLELSEVSGLPLPATLCFPSLSFTSGTPGRGGDSAGRGCTFLSYACVRCLFAHLRIVLCRATCDQAARAAIEALPFAGQLRGSLLADPLEAKRMTFGILRRRGVIAYFMVDGQSSSRALAPIEDERWIQLTATANGSTFQAPLPAHFSPSASSLICNALWFISLGLSLTCALIATLLEQWARDFLHRADMRSSPVIRARIYSYLYYGLKRFNMHTVVEIIPLLLHASLLFFFGGLVAFLLPINLAIAVVAAALLAVLVAIYSTLTLLPLWHLDCPYRTPLSTAVWRVSQSLVAIWYHPREAPEVDAVPNPFNSLSTETMVEAMSHRAMEISPARSARDYRALVWTVRSLADDVELEPFVEALPDLLWAPGGRRYTYEDHIQKLMRQSDLHLLSRIEALLRAATADC
ncbi:hypothetical protein B0H13DRAFT_2661999 [Mycena leptocephala]|nr:hypothetical protein B0H13DRAFT_2661999 [Mycena leptocephala]